MSIPNACRIAIAASALALATSAADASIVIGGTLEAGNTWLSRRDISVKDMRYASSIFLGSDTGLGPLYVGIGYAPNGGTAFYVFIGRP